MVDAQTVTQVGPESKPKAKARAAGTVVLAGLTLVTSLLAIWMWRGGNERQTAMKVGRTSVQELSFVIVLIAVGTVLLWKVLHLAGGSTTFFDGLTTAMSLGAQWLTNRKKLESWIFWIVVDVIYVPLYIYKDLHLTAILYAVFLCMAVMGLVQWHRTYRAAALARVRV